MKPTVLIGLGGIGSKTVDAIYNMMSDEQKKLTAATVLDTDIGDLQKLKSDVARIQTSPDVKVGNYVSKHKEVMSWFPYEYKKINEMMLTDGAGQVRALSRLSFYSAIERNSLKELDKGIEKLSLLNDSQYNSDVNIVIVGTIAGGTGSGSFLQAGMYMRDYFAVRTPNASVFIQGVFLLPDTIAKTGKLLPEEIKNVRFNAYAAMKELNAILSPSVQKRINIELEYRPGGDGKITDQNRPYDNILFFDYENSRNQHMESLEEYKSLMAETIYYAYISEVSSEYQSRFVNQILEYIRKNQESFYSASSVNKLIYPYSDIVEYLSLQWIIDEIDSEWLQFDKQYEDELKDYRDDLRKGVNRPKPSITETYINNLDGMERKEKSKFFTTVFNQTRIRDEKTTQISGTKDSAFVKAVEEQIDRTIQNDNDYKDYVAFCTIQPVRMEEMDNAKTHIAELEAHLSIFTNKSDDIVLKHQNILIKEIMTHQCGRDNYHSDNPYNINHWLIPKTDAMHPVSARYFLYKIQKSLKTKSDTLNQEIDKTKKLVESYYKKYDIPTSRDTDAETHYETAVEVIGLISGQSAVDKIKNLITNNKTLQFKPFVDVFYEHYNKQVSNIAKLIRLKLHWGVLQKLLVHLDTMIKNWEELFSMLGGDLMQNIEVSRNHLLTKHAESKKDIYIFATQEDKELLWKQMDAELVGDAENNTLSNEIAKAQYELFCRMISPEKRSNKEQFDNKTYEKLLIEAYKKALLEKKDTELNLNIFDAIVMQKRITQKEDANMASYISRLTNKNLPWIHTPVENLALTKFWGVQDISVLGKHILEGNEVVSRSFPKNEIVYLVMYHNLSITDFAKFAVGGPYFEAYHELMKNIAAQPERYVSPHIDKRWDSPTYMPDLNASIAEQTQRTLTEAFLFGLLEGNIYKSKSDGKDYYFARNGSKAVFVKVNGQNVEATRWLDLYGALSSNPIIVGDMMRLHNEMKDKSFSAVPWEPESDGLIKLVNAGDLIDILIDILNHEVRNENTRNQAIEIIGIFVKLIEVYIKEGYGEIKLNSASEKIKEVKTKLVERFKGKIQDADLAAIEESCGL